MDYGSCTGLLGASYALARSYQPNLLTRRSFDQAAISGAGTASAYGLFSAGDSLIASVASRISQGHEAGPVARVVVAGAVAATAGGTALALPWREHEPKKRTVARLAGQVGAAIAVGSLASTALVARRGRGTGAIVAGAALAVGAATYASSRTWKARPGSLVDQNLPGATRKGDQFFFEDDVREVSPAKAIGIGAAVAVASYGIARGESALTRGFSLGAAALFGGEPQDHRMLGRMASATATIAFGWFAVAQASGMLSKGGGAIEPGHSQAPEAPEITGSPASGLPWDKMTREGARWLSMTLTPEGIESVMGIDKAMQPIRVYASLDIAATEAERARVLLAEIDRTGALERDVFVLFSPTGSGYVNYVATETLEYLTGGNCASACIQYSVLPSALSLGDVPEGTAQTFMVLAGITERLMAMPAAKRPRFYLFGESLGSQVSEEMFRNTGILGLDGTGLDGALWIGTPSSTVWRRELWGDRSIADAPGVGPGTAYLPRTVLDWRALPDEQRAEVRFLLLQNGDDPIPKFGPQLAWRRPDWLGPDDIRHIGCPRGTKWVPGLTYLTTFFDMQSALLPTPGVFNEGGHDYRQVLPEAISQTWRLPMTPEQANRMGTALRQRELAWELHRDWTAAEAKSADEQPKAKAKALATASKYLGHDVDETELKTLVAAGLQPHA